jgi:hypothetical protein
MTIININEQRERAKMEQIDAVVTGASKFIMVTFQKEGIHRYPAAENDPLLATGDEFDVSFLAYPHRHIFHFRVEIEVFHNDRDLEFIQVKRQCEKWLGDGTLSLDHKSCEMMSDDLFRLIANKWPDRSVSIHVSEDGENGSIAYYNPINSFIKPDKEH